MIRLAILLIVLGTAVWAVEPDEMLADPVLEARAQGLDDELRCVQCRSENIASSNAEWARDARVMVRELIGAGASDAEVRRFFVERYGEVVLMRPNAKGANLLLWAAAPLMLLLGGGVALLHLRRQDGVKGAPQGLSDDEEERLRALLKE